ncbi:endo-1,4-beta-xylanase [Crossiella cryophila]|uniref:Beta-xylanase n=1 Tax=Crossiella cryophila TaxID=43355 RepID=A0A7W7FXH4_9PSEU|nr:endo-1,4-beta-xylanase [Crossiella cryophila]MBB4680648.1 endo-1,4-beta-xylanase [Crossiella cryophila]
MRRIVGALLLVAGLTGSSATAIAAPAAPVELIAGQDWTRLAGAEVTGQGVRISALDRWIVGTDGKRFQPNPPVNLLGPRLEVAGDFRLDAGISATGGKSAYLQLYGAPPIIYDEWRQEPPSLRLGLVGGQLEVAVWDGKANKAKEVRKFGFGVTGEVAITVRRSGSTLAFLVGGRQVGTVAERGVFGGGQVFFGADAQVGGGWTLRSLSASGAVRVRKAPDWKQGTVADSLRGRAQKLARPIGVGSALAIAPLVADDRYRAVAGEQFDLITPENEMKPQFLQPARGVFAFAEADALVDFARANGIKVHAHTLVWFEALPTWMRSAPDKRSVMLEHIRAVATHFAGRVAEWDVVNEPINQDNPDGLEHNLWYQAMGADYIAEAFRAARAADPNAVLYLNEYGAEQDGGRWNALYALVKKLRQARVPIDGVGLQSHEYDAADRVPAEVFRKKVRALAALGLKVRVSEMDVSTSDQAVQAKQFGERIAVCRQEPNCTGFTSWGFTDRYGSTADANRYPPVPGNALPWTTGLQPKRAHTALLNGLTP